MFSNRQYRQSIGKVSALINKNEKRLLNITGKGRGVKYD